MQNLVIVESPSKANTIKGYLGSNYKVVASVGHVRDLPKSSLGVDIENDFKPKYINIRGKGPLINDLKKQAKSAGKIFLATDPDREGEAISWHLANTLGIPEDKACRVTFNEITKNAVKAGIKQPRAIDMNLVNSQQTRRILDRIVGYKISPYLWKTIRSGLSAGRVQSVAARMIVECEEEIRAFIPVEYWTVEVMLKTSQGSMKARYFGDAFDRKERKLTCGEEAADIAAAAETNPFIVSNVTSSTKQRTPAPPFTTSTMQQEAVRKLNFQSARIMKVAQELYEGINLGPEFGGVHGLITYMRTDSIRVSAEARDCARELIIEDFGKEYYPEQPREYKSKAGAQDAHEAIRPSDPAIHPDKLKNILTQDQYRLYKLIWNRFIASQMASAVIDTVVIETVCGEHHIFRTSGSTVRFKGFLAVYEESTDTKDDSSESDKLPHVNEGEIFKAETVIPEQHFTEPPPRYNEASLIKALEEKGIGRPSTLTPTITTIISRGYVERDGKSLKPTQLGEITTKLMKERFPDIVDYQFTADMEEQLDNIENGRMGMLDVLNAFYDDFKKALDAAEAEIGTTSIELPVEETNIICEKCNSRMVVKNGRYGRFAACPNYPQCRNTKQIDKDNKLVETSGQNEPVPGMKCEQCGSDMVIRTSRYGSFYACINYPECKFTKKILKKIGVDCPVCGAPLVAKRGKARGSVFYSCSKYPECDYSSWDMPLNEKCPQCGGILFRKKGKRQVICKSEDCGYKRDEEPAETGDTGADIS